MYTPYLDLNTVVIYILMGLVPFFACERSVYFSFTVRRKKYKAYLSYILWYFIWLIFAVFRKVDYGIGGADAISYKTYFDVCWNPNSTHIYARHNDFLYIWLNRIVHLFTSDYHVLFAIIYTIIILSYIVVFNEFLSRHISKIPLTILVYIYLRGFVTIRTNLAVSLILFSIVACSRKYYKTSIGLAISSIFMHKASFFYALYLLLFLLYKKKKFSIRTCIMFIFLSSVAGRLAQKIILSTNISFFKSGAYQYYAGESIGSSFFDGFWKIAFSQLLLLLFMIIFRKRINSYVKQLPSKEQLNIRNIRLICYFDMILIPITYVLSIWRGYEYLYIFRLLMWGVIINAIDAKLSKNCRTIFKLVVLTAFISWMVFRLNNTYIDSDLMPYIFELF